MIPAYPDPPTVYLCLELVHTSTISKHQVHRW